MIFLVWPSLRQLNGEFWPRSNCCKPWWRALTRLTIPQSTLWTWPRIGFLAVVYKFQLFSALATCVLQRRYGELSRAVWALQLKRLKETSVKYDWKYVGYMSPEDAVSADDWSSYMAGEIRSDSWFEHRF